MTAFLYILILFFGRAFGLGQVALVFMAVALFFGIGNVKPQILVGLGVFSDIVMGSRFGVTGLLLLGLAMAIRVYTEKVDSQSTLSVLLVMLLSAVSASILWNKSLSIWQYIVCLGFGVIFWFVQRSVVRRGFGGGGVYLRTQN